MEDNEEISPTPNAVPVPPLINLQPNIRNCLASQTTRICQRAIAVYLERLSVTGVDENDRKVLDKLCPRISDKDVPDEDDDDDTTAELADRNGKKESNAFLIALLNCIYNRRPSTGSGSLIIAHFMCDP
ncbi:hypothetical protein BGZ65_013029, partial [Modicella reniformis]